MTKPNATQPDQILRERAEAAEELVQTISADQPVVVLTGPDAVDALFDWLND